jgi:hypothetical protein
VLDRLGDKGPNYLFVVAAGNGNAAHVGQLLKAPPAGAAPSYPVFPAIYGGPDNEGQANLISVAALMKDESDRWSRATFSDYGPAFVEIGAPGCSILVEDFDRDEGSWTVARRLADGTSFAAPLVSFTAGLISAENPDLQAQAVKNRILISADLNPTLVSEVADGRSLNVVKAISVGDDLLQTDHRILRGTMRFINWGTGEVYGSNQPIPIACSELAPGESLQTVDILKIVPGFNKSAKPQFADTFPDRVYVARGAHRMFKPFNCKLPDDVAVRFNQQGSAGAPSYKWSEIQDLIPRLSN